MTAADHPPEPALEPAPDRPSAPVPGPRRFGSGPVSAFLAGIALVVVGLVYATDGWPVLAGYGDAQSAPATVVAVRYVKPEVRQGADEVQLDVQLPTGVVPAEADPARDAPDGLRPGDRVTVRYDPAHPGRAMFPVGWGDLMVGVAALLLGVLSLAAGVLRMRGPAPEPVRLRYDEW